MKVQSLWGEIILPTYLGSLEIALIAQRYSVLVVIIRGISCVGVLTKISFHVLKRKKLKTHIGSKKRETYEAETKGLTIGLLSFP